MKPSSIGPLMIFLGCVIFIIAFAYGGCQPATSDAATVHSFERAGWVYDLTDEPYQDERLEYAIEGAHLYLGDAIKCEPRVFSFSAHLAGDQVISNYVDVGLHMPQTCDIWINAPYYNIWTKTRRRDLCATVIHEVWHANDPHPELGAHRVVPEDPEHVMQGQIPKVCTRLTKQDVLRKERRWCKRHKRECRKRKPDLAAQTLRPRSHR